MQAAIIEKTGDASVIKIKDIKEPILKSNEVLVNQKAIGVNFFDVAFRKGQYALKQMPAVLGLEACGIVEAVGKDVKDFKVGERVAYATGGVGAYAKKRAIHQHHLVVVPDNISDTQAAGSLLKGMMAHALLFRVFNATRAKRILVHAAAGGVGHLVCQWASHLGIEVIGTVGSDKKIDLAKAFGCAHVINYQTHDLVAEVAKITNNQGVGVVYDGVGKDTLIKSIECLWPMGVCVNYGEASGNCPPLDLNHLVANSIFVTRPTLALYKANRIELVLSANEVFGAISKGILKPKITVQPFSEIVNIHQKLEARHTVGSIVLTI
jgi:NADPH:quinone reductase